MADALLSIRALNKHFGGIVATDDVSLDIERGGVHAIIGPNGAGKTTLISQLCGQLKSDSGDIVFDGHSIVDLSTAKRAQTGLARSFQITSIVQPMTLLENVAMAVQARSGHSYRFWLPVRNEAAIQDAAQACLEALDLGDRAHRIAGEVSHGEQRQLEVAMALAMEPKLLLLDEPMAGLGKEESARMIEILASLTPARTILLVEHDMDAVFSLANCLSVLVNGRVIATGTVDEIRTNVDVQRAYLGDSHA
ncbi:MAG: ABC transporter ATP-binding protein [Pseudomonadota bacterium]